MIRRILFGLALLNLALAPVLAADKPLVIESGKIKQLPSSTTLQINGSGTGAASINIPHGTAPTSPNNGDCWTTTAGFYCRINGSTIGPYTSVTGALLSANNLSDVASASTSRTNLGLGTLATQSGTFSGTSSGTNTGDQTITLTGDVTGSGTGSFTATIANDAVTNAKAANMAHGTIKGRTTAGTGDPEDMTGTQATALLDTFTSSLQGLTPSSGGGTSNFLRADGTWAVPSGSGIGTVTTTGSPASGNLTKFSGATSITNGDLSGDVTTSGTLATTIANDAVSYAKMQNVSAASKLLGRGDSGSGDPQEITLGTGLSMSGTTLSPSGAPVLLEQHTASSSASLNFTTAISSTYDEYLIEFVNVIPATNAVKLYMRMSTDGGSTYDSGANYSTYPYGHNRFGAASTGAADSGANQIQLTQSNIDNTSTAGVTGTLRLYSPGSTSLHKNVKGDFTYLTGGVLEISTPAGWYRSTTAANAFQLLFSSGNISSGTIRVYGIPK